jgi:hypothetical protein
MSHEVHIFDTFGTSAFQHRLYKGITDITQVLDDHHAPRLDHGTFDPTYWVLATYAPDDSPALTVDEAAEGMHGYFDLQDIQTDVHTRTRLQAMLSE